MSPSAWPLDPKPPVVGPRRDLLPAIVAHSEIARGLAANRTGQPLDHFARADRLMTALRTRTDKYRWFDREWSAAMADASGLFRARLKPRMDLAWREYLDGVAFERDAGASGGSAMAALLPLLNPARSRFTGALARDPQLLEAALHLGRVEMLADRDERAAPLFLTAATSTRSSTAALARVFAGALAERRGRFAEAEVLYRQATAGFRSGHSAPLSLAQLLDRTARGAEARQTVDDMLDRIGRGYVADPWSVYFIPDRAGWALLRAEVMR